MSKQSWTPARGPLNFESLRNLYRARQLTPTDLVAAIFARIRADPSPNIWITLVEEQTALAAAKALEESARLRGMAAFPLYGIPFAVKDNIDIAGLPTTAACRDFAYTPSLTAPAVDKLLAAGALLIGKTNLDQFATGLTGLLSSYGPTQNPFNPDYISGGSSSGSAVALAAGLVSFALGTDTAGSGRVPAAFNHLVGLKPTRGLVSTRGLFPACRSLDCLSFLALNVPDAAELLALTHGFDPADPFSRRDANDFDLSLLKIPLSSFRFGVPQKSQLNFYGDASTEALYFIALDKLEKLGGRRIEIDASPFLETGKLLYQGPWIAERLASVETFFNDYPDSFHPITRTVMDRGRAPTATQTFQGLHKLAEFRRRADQQWALMDMLVLPTAGRIFSIAEASHDPIATSAQLGLYTNFVNLLDLAALALPAGFTANGLPYGISLIAPAFSEPNLVAIGQRLFPEKYGGLLGAASPDLLPTPSPGIPIPESPPESDLPPQTLLCVVGAHLSGQPLNYQLTELDGQLVKRTKTAPEYRLFALANTNPPKPGMIRVSPAANPAGENISTLSNTPAGEKLSIFSNNPPGAAIDVEVWSIPAKSAGTFLTRVPPPLCLGNILLEDGTTVKGFLCEPHALAGAQDISHLGGWLNYLARTPKPEPSPT